MDSEGQMDIREQVITDDDLLEIIQNGSEGGTEIIPSKYTDQNLPRPEEYTFPDIGGRKRIAENNIDLLRKYALAPRHRDHFPNHKERALWQKSLKGELIDQFGEDSEPVARLQELIDLNQYSGNLIAEANQAAFTLRQLNIPALQHDLDTVIYYAGVMRDAQSPVDQDGNPIEVATPDGEKPWHLLTREEKIARAHEEDTPSEDRYFQRDTDQIVPWNDISQHDQERDALIDHISDAAAHIVQLCSPHTGGWSAMDNR